MLTTAQFVVQSSDNLEEVIEVAKREKTVIGRYAYGNKTSYRFPDQSVMVVNGDGGWCAPWLYMDPETGKVGTYDDFWEVQHDGVQANAVFNDEAFEVVMDKSGKWIWA